MNTIANETITRSSGNSILTQLKNSPFLQLCVAVLVVQLGLATLLSLSQKTAKFATNEPLFTLHEDQINHIAIDDGNDTVKLKKQDDKWLLDSDIALPVDSARLNTLFASLVDLKAGLPVASSVNAREQLEVADKKYQRKLVANNDTANTLLLGTSPGLRKAHLRREGDNRIYSASLAISDIPVSVDQWLDKSLLSMKDINRIATHTATFERSSTGGVEAWTMSGNDDEDKTLDTEKLTAALKALENLRVTGLGELPAHSSNDVKKETTDENANEASETLDLTLTNEGIELQLYLHKADNSTIIKRSDINQAFTIPLSVFDQLSVFASDTDWLVGVIEEPKAEAITEE